MAMDIQHISALIEMLASLGFPASTNRQLVFYASLGQKNFVIEAHMSFGEDIMNYQLNFKEDNASKKLACSYYDATLRKAVKIAAAVINGIDVLDLEKRMAAVNWQMPLENNSSDKLQMTDKATWKQEAAMEEVIRDLELLSATAEGNDLASVLKYKFWTDPLLQSTIPEFQLLKSKYELSQRFYIINGEGITANEAYRFMNNRWLERQIHASNRLLRKSELEQKEAVIVAKGTGGKKRSRNSKETAGK